MRVAIGDHQHPAAGFDDARHLADAPRHVGKQHDAELRPGHVEAPVIESEGVAVHLPGLDGKPLGPRPLPQQPEHRGRPVGRQHPGAAPGGGNGERAAAGRHVEKPHARAQARPGAAPSFPSHICVGVLVRS